MEVLTKPDEQPRLPVVDNDFLQISSNWRISNNKQFREAFTTVATPPTFEKTNFEDVVSLETCVSLQSPQDVAEPCMLDIRVTNGQRISRIAVVSEAYVLEFFKQFGEYNGTVFAGFVDEFEDNSVFFAETAVQPPSSEASIKFTKTTKKDRSMWVYGIRLYLTEPIKDNRENDLDIFNFEQIKSFLSKFNFNEENNVTKSRAQAKQDVAARNESNKEGSQNGLLCKGEGAQMLKEITNYIDNKFRDMETRLVKRIDEMEERTNKKLDVIIKQLGNEFHEKRS